MASLPSRSLVRTPIAAILKQLLDAGADPNSPDPQGTTALMIAARTDGGTDAREAAVGTRRAREREGLRAIHRAHVGRAELIIRKWWIS